MLPDDVHDVCSGGIHVAITRFTPGMQSSLVTNFRDRWVGGRRAGVGRGTLCWLVDVHEVCSGGIHVAITRFTPGMQSSLVTNFRDR
jgi:hypothetical protein